MNEKKKRKALIIKRLKARVCPFCGFSLDLADRSELWRDRETVNQTLTCARCHNKWEVSYLLSAVYFDDKQGDEHTFLHYYANKWAYLACSEAEQDKPS